MAASTTIGLTKDYGDGHGLFDLDLEVAAGEVLGFLGPNGAGKSTTIRLLMGMIHPSRGSASGGDDRPRAEGQRLLPFTLSFAAVGAVLASRVPRAAVAVLGTIAFVSYLITDAGPLLKLPAWMIKSSVFSPVGTPLTAGVSWAGLRVMVGVTVGGFTAASLLMRRQDVGAWQVGILRTSLHSLLD
jgi:energy-coupling factor transporter ATP-binding protein EcfA2